MASKGAVAWAAPAGRHFQLLALDLDGTALTEELTMPAPLCRRLARLQATGRHVVLASGRMVASMARYARQAGLAGPAVAYNGAVIARLPEAELLDEMPVPGAVAAALGDFCRRRGLYLQVYHQDRVYAADPAHPEARRYARISGRRVHALGDTVYHPRFPPTKLLIAAAEGRMPGLADELAEHFRERVEAATSYPFYLEIVARGVDKGTALARVCRRLDVLLAETVAVGDGANDVSMLRQAGLGIAVAGAHPLLRQTADGVTGPGPTGVAAVIDRLWPGLLAGEAP